MSAWVERRTTLRPLGTKILSAFRVGDKVACHLKLDIKILVSKVPGMPPPGAEPSEPDFVERLIAQWESATPPRAQFRQQEALLRLVRLGGHLRREMDDIAAAEGLVFGQAQSLVTLRFHDPAPTTPTAVMAATTLTSGAVTAVLDRLQERKLLKRLADPRDRRGTLLRLTDAGRETADRIIAARLARNDRWLAPLSAAERRTLSTLLRKMLAAGESPPP